MKRSRASGNLSGLLQSFTSYRDSGDKQHVKRCKVVDRLQSRCRTRVAVPPTVAGSNTGTRAVKWTSVVQAAAEAVVQAAVETEGVLAKCAPSCTITRSHEMPPRPQPAESPAAGPPCCSSSRGESRALGDFSACIRTPTNSTSRSLSMPPGKLSTTTSAPMSATNLPARTGQFLGRAIAKLQAPVDRAQAIPRTGTVVSVLERCLDGMHLRAGRSIIARADAQLAATKL